MQQLISPTIGVVYFVFDADTGSDVSLVESARSLGAQVGIDPAEVTITVLSTPGVGIDTVFLSEHLGPFAAGARIVEVGSADYSQNKLATMSDATADVVAFADSDVIYRPDWMARIQRRIATGAVAIAGPPRFKPGSPLRTTLLLADFGLLWEDRHRSAPHVNLHNFAIRRSILEEIDEPEADYHRFGAPSFIARQLRSRGHWITLDRRLVATHGMNWRIWLGEKRMRRFAHAASMARSDPLADPAHAYGAHPTRPHTWLPLWWRWARRYQRRVSDCSLHLKMTRRTCILQRGLLAALSVWELIQISFLTIVRPALHRMARHHGWW